MANTTLRLLSSGAAISAGDLFLTRQGVDTSDRSITASQIKEYINSLIITQTAHGFAVGDVLYLNGTIYTKAIASSVVTAEAVGIVSSITDANTFVMITSGQVTGLSGLTAGTVYFLSPSVAGALTATQPVTIGQVVKPLFVASSTTAGYFINFRGELIVSGYNPVLSVTGLNTDNTDPQNPVVNISVDNITITGQGTPGSPLSSSLGDPQYIWTTSASYSTGQLVSYKGNFYRAISNNSGSFPDIAPFDWQIIAGSSSGYPIWDNGTSYGPSDVVSFEGNCYRCINSNSGTQPDNDVYANGVGASWEWIIDRRFPDLKIYETYPYRGSSSDPSILGGAPSAGTGWFVPKIPGNTLLNNGDKINYYFSGVFRNNDSNRRLGVYFGDDNSLNNIGANYIYDSQQTLSGTDITVFRNTGTETAPWILKGEITLVSVADSIISFSTEMSINRSKDYNGWEKVYSQKRTVGINHDIYLYIYGHSFDDSNTDAELVSGYIKFEECRI